MRGCQAVVEGAYFIFFRLGLRDGYLLEWVVDFAWLAFDLSDHDGGRHCC